MVKFKSLLQGGALAVFLFPLFALVMDLPLVFETHNRGTEIITASNELQHFALISYWLPASWLSAALLLIAYGLDQGTGLLRVGALLLVGFPLVHYGIARLIAELTVACGECVVLSYWELAFDGLCLVTGIITLVYAWRRAS
ncbi:hypothetical protein SAMN04488540_11281 [Ferrimonas sediminum]|uniref:Uncharacterized protein n=1 Tax=Ferrimonas sediminum TaxID=718193 RepID=A0A1G8W362_9GAMM|nr:hypothetical protein [Ferrimonas sediminum]SDJ72811.1 hypothetical protein SAMN04488540_11281 [Ferrimonas sediminum]